MITADHKWETMVFIFLHPKLYRRFNDKQCKLAIYGGAKHEFLPFVRKRSGINSHIEMRKRIFFRVAEGLETQRAEYEVR